MVVVPSHGEHPEQVDYQPHDANKQELTRIHLRWF